MRQPIKPAPAHELLIWISHHAVHIVLTSILMIQYLTIPWFRPSQHATLTNPAILIIGMVAILAIASSVYHNFHICPYCLIGVKFIPPPRCYHWQACSSPFLLCLAIIIVPQASASWLHWFLMSTVVWSLFLQTFLLRTGYTFQKYCPLCQYKNKGLRARESSSK